jgi:hypothetical protein
LFFKNKEKGGFLAPNCLSVWLVDSSVLEMDEKKLKEKISEVISLASEAIPGQMQSRFNKIFEIIEGMTLEEMNELDQKLILTKKDFDLNLPSLLVATVTRLNFKKIELIIGEIFRRAEDEEFQWGLYQLIGKCFFRRWTLLMAAEELDKKAKEIEKKPEVSKTIKATLYLAAGMTYERLGSGEYNSLT